MLRPEWIFGVMLGAARLLPLPPELAVPWLRLLGSPPEQALGWPDAERAACG